jgi:hypothetical protein
MRLRQEVGTLVVKSELNRMVDTPYRKVSAMGEEQSQWRNLGDAEFRSMFLKAASGQPDDADAFFGKFKYVSDVQQGPPNG